MVIVQQAVGQIADRGEFQQIASYSEDLTLKPPLRLEIRP